ncbi:FAD-dependent oxidoreductase [Microbacterium sp. 179-I 3D3 NHS]|uniref:FAD-dependent oxidoreductase n=1 Tax=Microbacterium sp. 179-I 3D3 NHS TaxID=3142382 RepID=UPI0039A0183D
MPDHDVVIVGAGPVGLMLACLLSQEGLRVAACERRHQRDPRTRAIGIHRPGLDALDAAGIGAQIRAEALHLRGGEVRSRRRTLASLEFTPDRPVLIMPQPRTDALLRARLHALAPGALRPGHDVQTIHDDGGEVRVVVAAADGPRELTASCVVVADGVHSRLRAEMGFGWRRRGRRATYAMVDVADPEPGDRAVLHCEPGGLVESFPLPGGRRRWVVRQGADAPLGTGAAFRAAVEERTGIRPGVSDDDRPSVFVAAQHAARRLQRGRIVLLGDAAHEISPIGGQGMNLGWTDAARLAAELAHSVPGPMPDLGRYARKVGRSTRAAQRRTAFYMSMGAPAAPAVVMPREIVMRAMGSRPLRSWSAGLITMKGL